MPSPLIEYTANTYHDRLRSVVQHLRDTADRMEREGEAVRPDHAGDTGPYATAAANAVHALMWGLADKAMTNGDDA